MIGYKPTAKILEPQKIFTASLSRITVLDGKGRTPAHKLDASLVEATAIQLRG